MLLKVVKVGAKMTSKTSQKMMQRRLKKLHILTPKKMPWGGGGIKKGDEKN